MAERIVAEYKEKEFERLRNYVLHLISDIECGLNTYSVSREIKSDWIEVPSIMEVHKLNSVLLELRENILTSEERELLKEETDV